MKKIFLLITVVLVSICFVSNVKAETITRKEFETAFKEVAYAYYARGTNLQYNSRKTNGDLSTFTPEEATSQNINYLVCSAYPYNMYYEMLGIYSPHYTSDSLKYARKKYEAGLTDLTTVLYGTGDKAGQAITLHINGRKIDGAYEYNGETITPDGDGNYTIEIQPNANGKYDVFGAILPVIKVGDVLTFTGHDIVIYELLKNDSGDVVDAFYMESGYGAIRDISSTEKRLNGRVNTRNFVDSNHYLYYGRDYTADNYNPSNDNNRYNDDYGIFNPVYEGSLNLGLLSHNTYWRSTVASDNIRDEYSILRFADEDENGNVILTYTADDNNGNAIELSQKTQYRLDHKRLYVEKTVDVHNDDVVSAGEELTYKIIIKNNSNQNYTDNITVKENISEYVDYIGYNASKNVDYNKSGNVLTFDIGKLNAKDEVEITYTVKVKDGFNGEVITSTGTVGNIPSSTVRNTIGNKLTEKEQNAIKTKYNELKNKYSGKELINKIYKQALGVDYNFDEFDITDLVINSKIDGITVSTFSLNENNNMYNMILNKYYNTLAHLSDGYDLKSWGGYSKENLETRRQDTIYPENFMTGDILVYINTDDPTVKENGEYAYIYIEGKGFVGKNGSGDAVRDSFNADYYNSNGLNMYVANNVEDDSEYEIMLDSLSESGFTREFINYQTLFGKDYYVILRPSLVLKKDSVDNNIVSKKNDDVNKEIQSPATFDTFNVIHAIVIILFITCLCSFLWIKLKKIEGSK